MADQFGLQDAVDTAIKGGVTFSKVVLLRLVAAEAEQIHDKEEDLKVELRNIERKVNRGEWPKFDKFEKASGDCDTLAKKVRNNHKTVLKLVKDDMKTARNGGDAKKVKLVAAVEDKLDEIGAFLVKQQRRPSAGELTLALMNRRDSGGDDKGPKRASSANKKTPGGHLLKEVQFFHKNNKDEAELKSVVKDTRRFDAMDKVVDEHARVRSDFDLFQKFMSAPSKEAVKGAGEAAKALTKFEELMGDAKRAMEALEKAFKRLERDMKDNKDVPASLQGSLGKAKDVIDKLEEDFTVKGEGKTAKEKFDAACKKLATAK